MFNTTEIIIDAFVNQLREGYRRTYGGLKTDYQDIIAWAGNMANVFVVEHEKQNEEIRYLAEQLNG
jgi:hypothetical protein